MTSIRFSFVAAIGAAACLPLGAAQAPDWVVRASRTTVPPEILQTRPAPDSVVLWSQQIVTAGASSGSSRLYRRQAVRALSPAGTSAGTFRASYDDDSKLDIEGAWTLHADGSADEFKLRDAVTVQVADPEYFTDRRIVQFRSPRFSAGDVAAYALSRKSRKDVFQWIVPLQSALPVVAQEVVIEIPDGWRHRWKLTHAPDGYSGPLSGEGGSKASYVFGPQRGIPEEAESSPESDRASTIEIALLSPGESFRDLAFQNWNDVGAWFEKKSVPARGEAPANLLKVAKDPVRECARWVQEKIRYVAVEVGEGGYAARPPLLVAQRLFGDCKDKGFLLIALLRQNGIEAFPVLTQPRPDGAIDPGFPTPSAFNHLIIAVREASPSRLPAEIVVRNEPFVIFDPTDSWTPFGRLSAGLQGGRGLLVRKGSAEIVEFPFAMPAINRLTRRVEARLGPGGFLRAEVTDVSEGAESERGSYQSLTGEERVEALARAAERLVPGCSVSKVAFSKLEDRDSPLEATFSVAAPDFIRHAGAISLLPVLSFSVGPGRIPKLDERRFPIDLGHPKRLELTESIEIPDDVRVEALPDPIEVNTAFAQYRFSVSHVGSRLVATERFEVSRPVISVDELSGWKAIEKGAAAARGARAVVRLS